MAIGHTICKISAVLSDLASLKKNVENLFRDFIYSWGMTEIQRLVINLVG